MPRKKTIDPSDLETKTVAIGRSLWEAVRRRRPTVFERQWWDERILSWAMADESVKVQMFRFVDVLPMLRTHEAVVRHLREYFEEVRQRVPQAARLVMDYSTSNTVLSRALALNARANARRMAERFIAGATVDEACQTVLKLRRQGLAFTLDVLGEAVLTDGEADRYQAAYLELLARLSAAVYDLPEVASIDRDHRGPIPRVNVSLKLSALDAQFRPVDAAGTARRVKERLRPILQAARDHGAHVHVDLEQYAYKELTLSIFREVLLEKAFRDFADVGIVVQAYLRDSDRDLHELLQWAKRRRTSVVVRLVKGAYWDYETVVARLRGWPLPVFQQKWQTDAQFERLARVLLENHRWLRPAFGTHNIRSVAYVLALAELLGLPPDAFELQLLYGMAPQLAQALAERGYRVRVYTPFGELLPGMAYLVRRLLENTSNESFLRHFVAEDRSLEELMMNPNEVGAAQSTSSGEQPVVGFRNEPHADFSRAETREAMRSALQAVKEQLGREYPLVIAGSSEQTRQTLVSYNPSHRKQVVGRVACATGEHAERAVQAARQAWPNWARVEPQYRAEYLELVAEEMRRRRFELAAWIVYECGKPWEEADADVAEAIDFCQYYAGQMRRLAEPRRHDLPGEENAYFYRPRGVAVVIAPWNFPLAILTGMTVAALVTGNTVVAKPAEQSSVVAAQLMNIFRDVGLPDGVVNFLPGRGEVVGEALVRHPQVDLVAFTGSREVGLRINRLAAETGPQQRSVKRVLAEMGGKNAIVVDDDADLDEAVQGVVTSAFGYAGQKCSACSRVVVLETVYDRFVPRLVDATASLPIGPAEEPGTFVGPLIDEEAQRRVLEYIRLGKQEATLAYAGEVGDLQDEGYYVAPHIFVDVDPQARIAQEEIFGPVLCILKAKDLDQAFAIANGTPYALTAGIYSRSPANLKRARLELEAGNVYLNRPITGALVERQPFGGFKLSGIGSKAGGPDYLLQFLIPIAITENTLRRGCVPQPENQ